MTPEPDLDKLAETYNFDHDRQEDSRRERVETEWEEFTENLDLPSLV